MNGHMAESKQYLRPHTSDLKARQKTGASKGRTIIACAVVIATILSLFYMDGTSFPSHRKFLAESQYEGYDLDEAGNGADGARQRFPTLVSSNSEPDSRTIDPQTGQLPLRKAIVISSYRDQDVQWLEELSQVSKGWEVYRYVSDADDTDYLPVKNPNGREALPYLTFITDNYANLPDVIVFNHGHAQSWHQPEPMADKIMALNLTSVVDEDYVNFRCQQSHGCHEDDMFKIAHPDQSDQRGGKFIKLIWEELLEKEVGPIADVMGRPCCAQFAVARQAVRRHSLGFWMTLRKGLEERHEGMEGWRGRSDYDVGLKFEMFWHVLFGKDPIHCPPRDKCERVYFQNAIHCNNDGEDLRGHDHWNEVKDDFVCVNDLRDD